MTDFTFDGVETKTFDEIPEGTYLGMIEKTEVGESNNHPTLRCQFRIVTGDYKDRVISDWLHFTQNAAGVVLSKITAAGVEPPTGLANAEEYAIKLGHLLVPKRAEIVVREKPYNGEMRIKVTAWKSAPAGLSNGSSPTDDDDIPFMYFDRFLTSFDHAPSYV